MIHFVTLCTIVMTIPECVDPINVSVARVELMALRASYISVKSNELVCVCLRACVHACVHVWTGRWGTCVAAVALLMRKARARAQQP